MLAPQSADQAVTGLAGFAHSIIAAVEVLALLELILQEVLFVGEFAVEAEELLFFFCELLEAMSATRTASMRCCVCKTYADVDLVLLVRVHRDSCSW